MTFWRLSAAKAEKFPKSFRFTTKREKSAINDHFYQSYEFHKKNSNSIKKQTRSATLNFQGLQIQKLHHQMKIRTKQIFIQINKSNVKSQFF